MDGRPLSFEVLAGVPVAVVAGLLVGTLGTFKHQAGVSALTGTGFPFGLVLSLAMVAAVLLALRAAFATRLYAAAAAVGVVAAVVVFGRPGPGGSDVVLADLPGAVWWIGPAVIAVLVVAVPGRRRRTDSPGTDGILEPPAKEEDPAP
ncbi:DUF6113 family protein [Amnibacterium sp.]|uniref:DUF6113 family protein n=1 Tax=Amnibacterium sp. TaxID=1872496 RepID=UPI002619A23E|nr:DUF6113 family protein [Amnibacterium sp.]MCU1473571.1 hypothetical protein [Amnibacterium sp.]